MTEKPPQCVCVQSVIIRCFNLIDSETAAVVEMFEWYQMSGRCGFTGGERNVGRRESQPWCSEQRVLLASWLSVHICCWRKITVTKTSWSFFFVFVFVFFFCLLQFSLSTSVRTVALTVGYLMSYHDMAVIFCLLTERLSVWVMNFLNFAYSRFFVFVCQLQKKTLPVKDLFG